MVGDPSDTLPYLCEEGLFAKVLTTFQPLDSFLGTHEILPQESQIFRSSVHKLLAGVRCVASHARVRPGAPTPVAHKAVMYVKHVGN